MPESTGTDTSLWLFLFFSVGEKYLISAKWLNFKCFVLCFEREMKIQMCDTCVGWLEKYTSGLRGWCLEFWVLFCSINPNIIFYFSHFWLNSSLAVKRHLICWTESELMDTGYIQTYSPFRIIDREMLRPLCFLGFLITKMQENMQHTVDLHSMVHG